MTQARAYSYKDIEMLLAATEVGNALKANIEELSIARSNWNAEYADGILMKTNNIIEKYLGLDKKQALKLATADVKEITEIALKELTFFKRQVEVDFEKPMASTMLNSLGIPSSLTSIKNGDQEVLIQVLYAFKKGMDTKKKKQITEKGMNPILIENLIKYAEQLKDAEVKQEMLKSSSKEISGEAVHAFNEIYSEVIGICKIASVYYQDNPLKKEIFTFSKIVGKMSLTKKKEDQPVEEN